MLAIVAAKLGYGPVAPRQRAVERAGHAENAAVNGVELDVRQADLRTGARRCTGTSEPASGPPVVISNLLRRLLLELAAAIDEAPPP